MNVVDHPGSPAIPDIPAGSAAPAGRRRGRWLGRLLRPAILAALDDWHVGRLTVHLPDGSVRTGGDPAAEPQVGVWVRDERFFEAFALRGDLGAGESYMDGEWWADDLPTFVELALRNQEAVGRETVLASLLNLPNDLLHLLRRNTRRGSRQNIGRHYDLSNAFFALFLDPTMTYSSAVFEGRDDSLASAQERKFTRFGDGLALGPRDHVLEIGCGWGAFAIHAARRYGCRVTGLTISREQFALARARVQEAGLAGRVDIRFCDYRDVEGRFSKIVSIEMLEAVGRAQWPVFFDKCHAVLDDGGLVGVQVITMPDHRFARYARHCDWIQKYIFPGGLLPSLGELCAAMSVRTPLSVRRLDDIAPHYAETLARWRRAFRERLAEVRDLGMDERFIRMWDFYLASCEGAFRARALGNLQLVLGRAGL